MDGGLLKMKYEKNGFTLIELMIAIAIIAILSAIAIPNYLGLKAKAQAAVISTNLHEIEDAVFSAIIDGNTLADFRRSGLVIKANNFEKSILKSFLSPRNFHKLYGVEFNVSALHKPNTHGPFIVYITIKGTSGTKRILEDLEKMFPKTLEHVKNYDWVAIDSEMLAVKPKRSISPAP
jgi:prepilin-type N-terminal cleavage/methylation domain-containing protein